MGTRAARDTPAFWLVLLAWTGIAVFVFAQQVALTLSWHVEGSQLPFLYYHLSSCWLWSLYTPLIFAIARRYPFNRKGRDTAVHLGMVLVLIAVETAVMTVVLPLVGMIKMGVFERALSVLPVDLFCYFCVVAIALALRFNLRARQLEGDLFESRLEALEAQLRPHFLFNALNTVASLVRAGESQGAIRAIAALGDVLRGSLRRTGTEVALGDELGLAERYLDLERARFGEGIRYRVNTAPGTAKARVPPLLLQPLVENALAHGRGRDGNVDVEIEVARCESGLRIEVRDGGSGPTPGSRDGIGLSNTRARLRHLYGADGRFQLLSRQGGGAVAVVELPLREVRP
ncbi:MAG TPA: histidine kinase [Myxococcales bacterium]|nr:histidine kinase [Myxococcales bacterium]